MKVSFLKRDCQIRYKTKPVLALFCMLSGGVFVKTCRQACGILKMRVMRMIRETFLIQNSNSDRMQFCQHRFNKTHRMYKFSSLSNLIFLFYQ